MTPIDGGELSGTPVLLVNPRVAPPNCQRVFAAWDGIDRGPLGSWREGRNDLERPAIALVPQIETVLAWLGSRPGSDVHTGMSGSRKRSATCFALFGDERSRDEACDSVPREWWRLATYLR